jgi:hypothetical protein
MSAITKMTGEEIIEYLCENIEPYEFEYDLDSHEDNLGKSELVDDVSETSGEAWLVYKKRCDYLHLFFIFIIFEN